VRDIRVVERKVEKEQGPQAEVVLGYCQAVRAALTDDGRPPLDLSPFSLRRFGPEPLEDERLRAACTWQYVHFYSDEQMPADLLRHGSA